MRWRGRRTSSRVEDRRGGRGGFGGRVSRGGLGGGALRGRGMRIGGVGAIVILVVGLFLGIDPAVLMGVIGGGGGGYGPAETSQSGPNTIDDATEEFVAVVLADTEEVWETVFAEMGEDYDPPSLVLFSGAVRSACGTASSAVGPFYCPGDDKAYLDTSFFETLASRHGAAGDFAAAYVIAHEVAHHVQNELGISSDVNAARSGASETEANRLSVRLELQADCLAGVWAVRADERFGVLEPGDIEEALTAAAAIGDDTLQRRAEGQVVPDSFTHGTSAQRVRWFRRGYESGEPTACDTFSAAEL
ncbi:MAG TPA: neutral zinc metallopeptidase [Thermohalobaculum sp.]|nr:neutral zinc metallopeptidase [Thermohalobaculum sp.]